MENGWWHPWLSATPALGCLGSLKRVRSVLGARQVLADIHPNQSFLMFARMLLHLVDEMRRAGITAPGAESCPAIISSWLKSGIV